MLDYTVPWSDLILLSRLILDTFVLIFKTFQRKT